MGKTSVLTLEPSGVPDGKSSALSASSEAAARQSAMANSAVRARRDQHAAVEHAVSNVWGTVDGLGARSTWYGDPNAAAERQPPDLLLASLEQLRDFYDRRGEGVALIVAQHASWSRLKETTRTI